jgi:hypothetical protein
MGQSMRRAAAGAPWPSISPNEAGFTSDLEARLDEAITQKRVWIARSTSPMVDVDEIRQYGYHLVPGQIRVHRSSGPALRPLTARAFLERDW